MNWPNFDSSLGYQFNFFDSNSHLFSRLRDDSISSNILFQQEHPNNAFHISDHDLNFHELSQQPQSFPSPPSVKYSPTPSSPIPNDLHLSRYRTGLKDLAKLLIKLIRSNQPVSQGQIVQFIESNISCLKQQHLDESKKNEKNIKRRIYDALNVMISAGLLIRDNNHIGINPPPTMASYHERFDQKTSQIKVRVEKKKELLNKLKTQKKALSFWLKQNKKSRHSTCEKIPFPLIFVMKSHSQLEMGWNEELFLIRNTGLQFYSETDIIERVYSIEEYGKHILEDVTLQLYS